MRVCGASSAALALAVLGGLAAMVLISGRGNHPPLTEIALAADMLVVEQSCKGFSVNYQALDHALARRSTLSMSLPGPLSDKGCVDGSS